MSADPARRPARMDLARRVYAVSHLVGEFKLRSGATSREYFDKYAFEADPELLRELGAALAGLLPRDAGALAELELGGVPLGTVISQSSGLPLMFVRKEAKPYGTRRQVEGLDPDGLAVVIVEDVVTSGGAILDGLRVLRAGGADVVGALCAIDREGGAAEALAAEDVPLRGLFTMAELEAAAAA